MRGAALALALAACGANAERIPTGPPASTPPPEEPQAPEIQWNDECSETFDWSASAQRDLPRARSLRDSADDELAVAEATMEPPTREALLRDAIDRYRDALTANPFDGEATYGLAVAYTELREKGCALVVLGRLGSLQSNPALAGGQSVLDMVFGKVHDDPAFAPFRKDAMNAIAGATPPAASTSTAGPTPIP